MEIQEETKSQQVVRLAPRVRQIALRYRNQIDPDDLAQEAILDLLQAKPGQTDSWYLTRAKWCMTDLLRSKRYRPEAPIGELPEPPHSVPDGRKPSAVLSELTPDAQRVALLRWAGADWAEVRRAVGQTRITFASHELRARLR